MLVKKISSKKAIFATGFCLTALMLIFGLINNAAAQSIPEPAASIQYTWNVEETNGYVEWWTTSWQNLGNQTFTVPGQISYTLTGKFPNDMFGANVTGDVWFGDFEILVMGETSNQMVNNWTRENCSNSEVAMALTLSVVSWPTIQWYGGLVSETNWTFIESLFAGNENISVDNGDSTFEVLYNDTFQDTNLVYDKNTGVLLSAYTMAGDYYMKLSLDLPQSSEIPGYEPGLALLEIAAMTAMIALVLSIKKSRDGRKIFKN
ncbi:MAG: hypothetical protein ACTSRA_22205 [Promethearchaeota archaeon]